MGAEKKVLKELSEALCNFSSDLNEEEQEYVAKQLQYTYDVELQAFLDYLVEDDIDEDGIDEDGIDEDGINEGFEEDGDFEGIFDEDPDDE